MLAIFVGLWAAAMVGTNSTGLTDRFCVDCFATSPNAQYRFSSTHPNNQLARPEPFVCRGFTFKLTDLASGEVVWQRLQREDEGPPASAWVDDSGAVVLGPGERRLLDGRTGEPVFRWDILKEFTREDDAHVVRSQTTAGPLTRWSRASRSHFLRHEGRLYFVTRTWWDRRVWADLTGRVIVTGPAPALAAAADVSDRQFVLEVLPGAAARLGALHPHGDWHDIQTAIHLAGKLGVAEAVPHLRELSDSEYTGHSGGIFGECADEEISVYAWGEYTFRQGAHLALRRLGQIPGSQPCTQFSRVRGEKLEDAPREPLAVPRATRASEVVAGMNAVQVLERIGAPDFAWMTNQRPIQATWDYDMDTDDAYSLRVHWNDRCTVDRVEVIRPPLWQSQERDRALYQR